MRVYKSSALIKREYILFFLLFILWVLSTCPTSGTCLSILPLLPLSSSIHPPILLLCSILVFIFYFHVFISQPHMHRQKSQPRCRVKQKLFRIPSLSLALSLFPLFPLFFNCNTHTPKMKRLLAYICNVNNYLF